jgi:hypothetical protein
MHEAEDLVFLVTIINSLTQHQLRLEQDVAESDSNLQQNGCCRSS